MSGVTGVIGVDFGSSRFVIAAAKRGNVDVVVNESNYRQTPSLVTYGAERAVGDAAINKVKKELRNSVHMPLRLLGDVSDAELEQEMLFSFSQVRRQEDGGLRVALQCGKQAVELVPEQVMAALFSKLQQILALHNSGCSTLVVSVPSTFDPPARQAVMDAARIAGLEVSLLVNESSAALLSYGIFRKGDLDAEKPRTVVFVDVGHAKTSVFAARVLRDSAEIFFEKTDGSLGVRELDRLMFSFYAEKVLERIGKSVADFPKARLRLLEAIEKQRKTLSANAEARISLDCLIEDQDFSFALSRDEYLRICESVFDRFQQFFLLARNDIGELPELHSVERIGGGSRIPLLERLIAVAFGIEGVAKTLDAGECIARGATIRAAMISPLFRVADFTIKDRLAIDLRVRFKYDSDAVAKDALLFARGCDAGKVLSVTLSKDERLNFQVYVLEGGRERPLLWGEVERMNPRSERCEAKVFFAVDSNLLVRADRAEVRETLPGAPDESGVAHERVETRPLKMTCHTHFGLGAQALDAFREAEKKLVDDERALAEAQSTKYTLEAFIYDTRTQIEEAAVLTSAVEKTRMFAALEDVQNWLYSSGEEATADVLKERAKALQADCKPFLHRRTLLVELEDFLPDTRAQAQKLAERGAELASELRNKFDQALQRVHDQIQTLDALSASKNPAQLDKVDFGESKRVISASFADAEKVLKKAIEAATKAQKKEEPPKSEDEPTQP